MAYVSKNYDNNPAAPMGSWVGDGECVTYVKAVIPGLPSTPNWKKGRKARNDMTIQSGTLIATFGPDGRYHGHAAIYESQSGTGLNVVDQWITPPKQPVHRRTLRFGAGGNSNNGDNFYVVE